MNNLNLKEYSVLAKEAAVQYLKEASTVRRGIYSLSEQTTQKFDEARETISNFFGCQSKEVVFVGDLQTIADIWKVNIASGPFNSVPLGEGIVDVTTILHRRPNFDLMFCSGEALGARGINILFGKEHILNSLRPFEGGGDMIKSVTMEGSKYSDLPHKFEAGTPDIGGVLSLGAAMQDYSFDLEEIESISNEIKQLLESKDIEYKYYSYSSAFEIKGQYYYVSKKNPKKSLELFKELI